MPFHRRKSSFPTSGSAASSFQHSGHSAIFSSPTQIDRAVGSPQPVQGRPGRRTSGSWCEGSRVRGFLRGSGCSSSGASPGAYQGQPGEREGRRSISSGLVVKSTPQAAGSHSLRGSESTAQLLSGALPYGVLRSSHGPRDA